MLDRVAPAGAAREETRQLDQRRSRSGYWSLDGTDDETAGPPEEPPPPDELDDRPEPDLDGAPESDPTDPDNPPDGPVPERNRAPSRPLRVVTTGSPNGTREVGEYVDRLLPGGAFILDRPEGIPARWGRGQQVLAAFGEPTLLVGPTGVGKTTLVQNVVAAALGIREPSVLGFPVAPAERVLYLACDRPDQVGRAFRRLIRPEDRDLLDERLVIWKGPPPRDMARDTQLLSDMCLAAGADVAVVDSIKDVAFKVSDDEVGAGVNSAFQRAIVAGTDVFALHHQRKRQQGAGKPKTKDDIYGSVWIPNGAGSVLLLWGEPGDPIVELSHLKQPAEVVGPLTVAHDAHTGISTVESGPADPLVILANMPQGITATDLARIQKRGADPTDNDRRRAARRLDALAADGLVEKTDQRHGGAGGSQAVRYVLTAEAQK